MWCLFRASAISIVPYGRRQPYPPSGCTSAPEQFGSQGRGLLRECGGKTADSAPSVPPPPARRTVWPVRTARVPARLPCAVRMTTVRSPPSSLSERRRSRPPIRDMTRSLMMMDGRKAMIRWSASSPSAAASVVNPHVRTSSVSPSRVVGSSSTTRTRSREVVDVTRGRRAWRLSSMLACRFRVYTVSHIYGFSGVGPPPIDAGPRYTS